MPAVTVNTIAQQKHEMIENITEQKAEFQNRPIKPVAGNVAIIWAFMYAIGKYSIYFGKVNWHIQYVTFSFIWNCEIHRRSAILYFV